MDDVFSLAVALNGPKTLPLHPFFLRTASLLRPRPVGARGRAAWNCAQAGCNSGALVSCTRSRCKTHCTQVRDERSANKLAAAACSGHGHTVAVLPNSISTPPNAPDHASASGPATSTEVEGPIILGSPLGPHSLQARQHAQLEAAHAIAQKSAEAEMAARLKRVIQVHLYVDVSECLLA
jgi:hypothetical protein